VRATLDGTKIASDEIKEPSSCSKDLVQARVTAENEAALTLTFSGGTATPPSAVQRAELAD
jgi:hypothetical protein